MRVAVALAAALVVSGCARKDSPPKYNDVEITASDYAFNAPATIAPGQTTFRFVNSGKVRHELNITRLRRGVSIDRFLSTIRSGESVQSITEGPVGVLFAEPGGSSSSGLSVNVTAGETYAVICIFRDSAGAKRHYDMGMYSTITVVKHDEVVSQQQLPTDTVVATDYAFQYPRTVMPGRHAFVMRNDGRQRHQLDIMLLKPGATLQRLQELEKSGGDVDSLFDGDFGLLHGRSGQTSIGQLTIDMLPDREYVIACFFRDNDQSPEHYELGMFGAIHTTGASQ